MTTVNLQNTVYERLWHLIIPPVMTLLDDYEVRYKLPGVRIISEMLDRVPPELLRRTGMDGLIFSVRFYLKVRHILLMGFTRA